MSEIINNQTAKQRAVDAAHVGATLSGVSGVPAGTAVSIALASVSTATAATAGSASALPSPPAGYFLLLGPNGTVVKMPYFNA